MKKHRVFSRIFSFAAMAALLFCIGCPNPASDNDKTNAATPVITLQPVAGSYNPGDTAAALKVTATVSDGGTLSYQWYKNTVNSTAGGETVGSDSNSYTPEIASVAPNGIVTWYYVTVTNTNNSVDGSKTASATSSVVSVTVMGDDWEPGALPLIFKVSADGQKFEGTYQGGGNPISTTIEGTAAIIENQTLTNKPSGKKVVMTNLNGYVSLGNTVGRVLKTLDTWSIETYVLFPEPSDWNIDEGVTDAWEGKAIFSLAARDDEMTNAKFDADYEGQGPSLWLPPAGVRFQISPHAWGKWNEDSLTMDGTNGWPNAARRWRHLVVTVGSDNAFVYMDGQEVMHWNNESHLLKTKDLEIMTSAYLGRGAFWANGDKNLKNAQYYQFAVYDHALTPAEITGLGAADILLSLNGNPAITDFTFIPAGAVQESENSAAAGATVGTFTNPQGGTGAFTYTLVNGEGDTNNNLFVIDGNSLKVGAAALTAGSKSVRIRAADTKGETFEKIVAFMVQLAVAQTGPLMMHYTFDNNSSGSVTDATGYHVGTLNGGAVVEQVHGINVLRLTDSGTAYFDLGADVESVLGVATDYTVAAYLYTTGSMEGNGWFPWTFAAADPVQDHSPAIWFAARGDFMLNTNSQTGWVSTREMRYDGGVPRGVWIHVLFTQTGSTGKFYVNGTKVAEKTDYYTLAELNGHANGPLQHGWLGKVPFEGDTWMKDTSYADFRLYNAAITDAEIASIPIGTTLAALNGYTTGSSTVDAGTLALKYAVNDAGSAFVNTAGGSAYSAAALEGTAAIATVGGRKVVDLGTDGYITLPQNVGPLLINNSKWTIETYALAAPDSDWWASLFAFRGQDTPINGGGYSNWKGAAYFYARVASFRVRTGGWDWGESIDSLPAAGMTYSDRWRHFAITGDNGQVKVYIDGNLVMTQFASGGPVDFADALDDPNLADLPYGFLGKGPYGDPNLKGKFYSFAIYTDALTAAQINQGLGVQATLNALNGQ